MQHYLMELAFWILLAFFSGCFLGGGARMRFGAAEVKVAAEPEPVEVPVVAVKGPTPKSVRPKKTVAVKAKPAKRAGKK